jgi:hypothetical protein
MKTYGAINILQIRNNSALEIENLIVGSKQLTRIGKQSVSLSTLVLRLDLKVKTKISILLLNSEKIMLNSILTLQSAITENSFPKSYCSSFPNKTKDY